MERSPSRIVGIGASSGALGAVRAFFRNLRPDTRLAYVVVAQLSADSLRPHLPLPLVPIVDGLVPVPDHVYVAPADRDVVIEDGQLRLVACGAEGEEHAPIDRFLRSLAGAAGKDAVGVILSGTGADGGLGLKRIKEHDGLTAAQDPDDAEYDAMPRAAIATGLVDLVAPAGDLLARVLAIASDQDLADERRPRESLADALRDILTLVRLRTGHDFSNYKRATLLRRISRRMQVAQTESMASYLEVVREHPSELGALLRDFLISVTNFFRDQDAFRALEQLVMPKIFEGKDANSQVRIWVPGCATGEEAYSLAMLACEEAARHPDPPHVQVFATDIDEDALAEARAGRYRATIAADLAPERLERWFTKEAATYVVRKELRDAVLFSSHNVLRDPPFSKLDLISCRNLLIYLNREAQDRVLGILHFGLRPDGFLYLGSSESAEHASMLFAPVDGKHRIYTRRTSSSAVSMATVFPIARWGSPPAPSGAERTSFGEIHHRLVELYAPPSVLVNEELDIVHVSESAGRYLTMGGGEPSRNLLRVVHAGLRLELRAAIYNARQPGRPSESRSVRVELDGAERVVRLTVRSFELNEAANRMLLVMFEERETEAPTTGDATTQATIEPVVRQLEDELHRTRDQLRGTIEQYETSVEELKASNEELHAINEELRSASEELETSKEELQVVNEELTTLNAELKDKVDEVSRANSDLQNLMTSTDIAVVFLDRHLDINRFTPRAQDLFNIIAADVGRPLAHLTHKLDIDDLADTASQVMQTLRPIEREVRAKDGRRYLARIHPYRSVDDRIDGVVLTFLNVTELEAAQDALRARETMLRLAERAAGAGSWEIDAQSGVMTMSDEYRRLHAFAPTAPIRLEQMFERVHELDRTRVQQAFRRAFEGEDLNLEHRLYHPEKGVRWMWKLGKISNEPGRPRTLAGITVDVTERRAAEAALRESEERFRLALRTAPVVMLNQDRELRYTWGYMAGGPIDFIGKTDADLFPPDEAARLAELKQGVLATGIGRRADVALTLGGQAHHFDFNIEPILGERASVVGVTCAAVDVTTAKQAELALRDADRRKDEFLATLAHELRNPLAPLVAALEVLRIAPDHAEAAQRAREVMRRQLTQLIRLVDDLLDVARITQGKIALRLERHRLGTIVDAALEATRSLFDAANHRIEVQVPAELEVECDDTRMTQVLTNLLANAAKYSPRGGHVTLTADADDHTLVIRVRDRGIGIAPELLPHIFDLFVQAEGASASGLGIGLNIVRRLVQLHGGTIEAHSAGAGLGAEMVVRVPIGPRPIAASPAPARATSSRAVRRRVLVVDDNRDVSETIGELVRMIGHEVRIADDGESALAIAEAFAPDAVLLDIGMPGMNGFDVARALRGRDDGRALLLIAVSGWGQPSDVARSQAAGFDHHLVKPAALSALRELLGEPNRDAPP
ncbi:MAG TPA: CheR family methyltransferase [Kofleriaceae bacterium]|nr:CheR family methyltransferase [Kofleriaceae bacterium]